MASFALTLRSRPNRLDGILVILAERRDADEMAFEMRRNGHDVDVQELRNGALVAPGPAPAVCSAVPSAR
jgi:hypothetical protein